MTTVAAAAIATSAATAQTYDQQRRETPGAAEQTPSKTEQGRDRIRDVTPSRNTTGQGQAQGQTTQPQGQTTQPMTGQNSQQPSSQNSQTGAAPQQSPSQQSTQSPPQQPPSQQSTQNPPANQPSSAQTAPAQPNQNQQSGQSGQPAQNQAAQPSQSRAAQGQAPQLTSQQQTRVSSIISKQKVEPVTRVNFSINVGVAVPASVHLHAVPADIVEIVPQYRGYSYFVTADRIVIVEPRTHQIVYLMPYGGSGRAASTSTSRRSNLNLTNEQREVIRKSAHPARRTTTGSSVRREVTIEEEVPSSVELEEFDEPVVRELPSMRGYRYYRNDDDVVIVDPGERRVLDVIR